MEKFKKDEQLRYGFEEKLEGTDLIIWIDQISYQQSELIILRSNNQNKNIMFLNKSKFILFLSVTIFFQSCSIVDDKVQEKGYCLTTIEIYQ